MKTVLVTGGAGYIGSVLVRQLVEKGYKVRVIDLLRCGGDALLGMLDDPNFEFVKADVRDADAVRTAVQGVWGIAHLAAIVGDPACAREPELARSINYDGSVQLYDLAEPAGVERFIFSSTCSNYGKMADGDGYVDEEAPLRPVSLYAETKVAFERYLAERPHTNTCKPVSLRFSTVYGLSPRLRFDLTVNEFTKELAAGRELVVFGEQFWRPYCHVRDLARAVVAMMEARADDVAFDVFNVGDTQENYQKRQIVEHIRALIPESNVRYVQRDEDPRDYRVRFEKIRDRIGFQITRRVPDGIREIKRVVDEGFITDIDDPRYYNTPPQVHA